MKTVKKAYTRSKKFVVDHKVGIAVTLTALTCFKINRSAINQHHDFLKEKGLYDEYYAINEEV